MHRCGKTFIISFLKLCSSNSTIVCVYWLNVEYKNLKGDIKNLGGSEAPPPPCYYLPVKRHTLMSVLRKENNPRVHILQA